MAASDHSDGFYDGIARVSSFAELTDPASYAPLPGDWVLGTADIVGSTRAIADGKYKMVNMVGAAVISAQINAAGGRAFPFVFGGDGAGFATPPSWSEGAAQALAAVQCWAAEEFGLQLRTAQVPVQAVRDAGLDVAVARFQASEGVDYAMFGGGGMSWAEARMKEGRFALPAAPAGTKPDLTGLSCRWSNMTARNGAILSVVIEPVADAPGADFARLADRVIALARRLNRDGHPLAESGAQITFPSRRVIDLEAHATHGERPMGRRKLRLWYETVLAWFFLRTGIPVGGFDPGHYKRMVGRNADFRKFDDGLKMTLDSDPETARQIREVLEAARREGIIRYGLHEQAEAMMTCIVPSMYRDDHVHFIDGASGGYASAAARMRAG